MNTILYIAGHEFSGSTVVDLLLQRYFGLTSIGEAGTFASYVQGTGPMNTDIVDSQCACGSDFAACPFWSDVLSTIEATGANPHALLMLPQDDSFTKENKIFLDAIFKSVGDSIILDSSKSGERLKRLLESAQWDIRIVLLTRPLIGYLHSYKKRFDIGRKEVLKLSMRYAWRLFKIRLLVRNCPTLIARHEDIMMDTEGFVESVSHLLDRTPREPQPAKQHAPHNLAGNKIIRLAQTKPGKDPTPQSLDWLDPTTRYAVNCWNKVTNLLRN